MVKAILCCLLLSASNAFACFENDLVKICEGDLIYRGNTYSFGANVLTINSSKKTMTLMDNFVSETYTEKIKNVFVTYGCIGAICVGDKVFKDNEYPNGAEVLAINAYQNKATIIDDYWKSLHTEKIKDLTTSK
jgi:hypothetical protein